MAVLCDPCSPVLASAGLVTVVALLLGGALVVWLLLQGRSLVLAMDRERVRDDLLLRGAVLKQLTPNASGDRNERGYEVVFQKGDGSTQTAVCKTNAAQGVWWQGEVPPPLVGPDVAPPTPGGLASAPLMPAPEQVEPEPSWDSPSADREYEGEEPEQALRPVAELLAVLRGGESRACERAVADLVRHGPGILPELEEASQDPDPDVRVDVKKAIDLLRPL
jgi:hypothetical protein